MQWINATESSIKVQLGDHLLCGERWELICVSLPPLCRKIPNSQFESLVQCHRNSGTVRLLPKSTEWLNVSEKSLGVVLLQKILQNSVVTKHPRSWKTLVEENFYQNDFEQEMTKLSKLLYYKFNSYCSYITNYGRWLNRFNSSATEFKTRTIQQSFCISNRRNYINFLKLNWELQVVIFPGTPQVMIFPVSSLEKHKRENPIFSKIGI
jgi:hypothetical protein